MKTRMLTFVSAIALMGVMPAKANTNTGVNAETQTTIEAQQNNNPDRPDMPTVTERDIEQGWQNTKETVAGAAEATGEAIEDTYYDVTNAFQGDNDMSEDDTVTIQTRTTAQGMIGKDVYNANGEAVAGVEDIILNADGDAEMIVLRDGGFFGMGGKLVALEYSQMTRTDQAGDVMLPVSETMLDKVAEFSYDRATAGENMRVIPANGISVSRILDGNIQNNRGEQIADIENVTFVDGTAHYVVVSFNELLGIGGDTAVMEFGDLQPVQSEGQVNFKLTAKQSADFETFKQKMDTQG